MATFLGFRVFSKEARRVWERLSGLGLRESQPKRALIQSGGNAGRPLVRSDGAMRSGKSRDPHRLKNDARKTAPHSTSSLYTTYPESTTKW